MKALVIDIETTPMKVYAWGLFQQNIGISQIAEPTKLLCFAYNWLGSDRVKAVGGPGVTHESLVQAAWDLLNEADVVIHYNGKRFDVPHLNREFLEAGLPPPSPYRQVDLYQAVRSRFKFASNKLDYVSQRLLLGEKTKHGGFQLWLDCMAGDPKAWKLMLKYCRHDVDLTAELYETLLPWIPNHPNVALLNDAPEGCVSCGRSDLLVGAGHRYTQSGKFQRYQCSPAKGGCGRFQTSVRRVSTTDYRIEPL